MKLHIFGLHRTGTNWLNKICKENLKIEIIHDKQYWKHQLLDSPYYCTRVNSLYPGGDLGKTLIQNHKKDVFLVIKKTYKNWIYSLSKKENSGVKNFIETYGDPDKIDTRKLYDNFYKQWEAITLENIEIIQYEELINNITLLKDISEKYNISLKNKDIKNITKVSQSNTFTDKDREFYTNNK